MSLRSLLEGSVADRLPRRTLGVPKALSDPSHADAAVGPLREVVAAWREAGEISKLVRYVRRWRRREVDPRMSATTRLGETAALNDLSALVRRRSP